MFRFGDITGMTMGDIKMNIQREIDNADRIFDDTIHDIEKIYIERINNENCRFRRENKEEVLRLYDFLVNKVGSERELYKQYISCPDVEEMINSSGFYESDIRYKEFLTGKNNRTLSYKDDLYCEYVAIYYDIYSRIENLRRNESMIKMAYLHVHDCLDEYILEIIYATINMEVYINKTIETEEAEKTRKKAEKDNLRYRLTILQKKGFNISQDDIDNAIHYTVVRNVLIHNNGIINQKALDDLKETKKFGNIYVAGDSVDVNYDMYKKYLLFADDLKKKIMKSENKKII